jgi:hypothetical protein
VARIKRPKEKRGGRENTQGTQTGGNTDGRRGGRKGGRKDGRKSATTNGREG